MTANMRKYVLAHRNGIDGLELETAAPIPELRSPTDVGQRDERGRPKLMVRS